MALQLMRGLVTNLVTITLLALFSIKDIVAVGLGLSENEINLSGTLRFLRTQHYVIVLITPRSPASGVVRKSFTHLSSKGTLSAYTSRAITMACGGTMLSLRSNIPYVLLEPDDILSLASSPWLARESHISCYATSLIISRFVQLVWCKTC